MVQKRDSNPHGVPRNPALCDLHLKTLSQSRGHLLQGGELDVFGVVLDPGDGRLLGLQAVRKLLLTEACGLARLNHPAPKTGVTARALRALDADLVRTIQGFEALLVMSGSTPSANL